MTTTEIDLDLTMLEDYEFEASCEGVPGNEIQDPEECDRAARWHVRFSCGCLRIWCDWHLEGFRIDHAVVRCSCATCFADRISIAVCEPLNRRS